MLTKLTIHNYALINELEVEFKPGFIVITGETGAGKSIILGALQLLLGARADARSIMDTARPCRIEAEFTVNGETRIITRVLNPNGKSRAFIDDEPVTLTELKEVTDQFIDIHSQHQNLLLQTTDFQLSVIDTLAQNREQQDEYSKTFTNRAALQKELATLQEEAEIQERERDFMQFQLDQLLDANIQAGEEQDIEAEIKTLSHASETCDLLLLTDTMLCDDEHGVLTNLRAAAHSIRQAADFYPPLAQLADRANIAYIDIKDMADEIAYFSQNFVINPELLQKYELRLDLINTLLHKHHVSDTHALIEIQKDLEKKLTYIDNIQDEISDARLRLENMDKELLKKASALSHSRKAVFPSIKNGLHETLAQLGMSNARIDIVCDTQPKPTSTGIDNISFVIAANQGSPYNPLASLSGGEAARVMLAIKSLLTGAVQLPTIIFDEIDTGVSGRIAEAMGRIMQAMGRADRQVISITHLPQIAAKGDEHYRVYKKSAGTTTQTHIQHLSHDERIREIATMLSGEDLTSAAIENAQALLKT